MEPLVSTLLILGAMGAIVLGFRALVRRPHSVTSDDPPGVRTVAVFEGGHAELFADDPAEGDLAGVRLFQRLCDGLAAAGVTVAARGLVENAQRAECQLDGERFWIVLEWLDPRWSASVEWVPRTAAEHRHLRMTGHVFAPPDTPALRRLLIALDTRLRAEPHLRGIVWHRKEKWLAEDVSEPAAGPIEERAA